MINSISEKIIEDILTSDKSILSEVLSLNFSDLSLIARQKNCFIWQT
jgi:DNA polymerase III psi subunit